MIKYFLYGLIFASFSSCMSLYGINRLKDSLGYIQIEKFAIKNNIENVNLIKETEFNAYLLEKQLDSNSTNLLLQPLQVLCFVGDTLTSMYANCNSGGFPNLKWNFQTDKKKLLKGNVENLSMNILLSKYSQNFSLPLKPYNNTIIVHWNYFMGRQSEKMIEEFRKIPLPNIQIYFVNNDGLYADIEPFQ